MPLPISSHRRIATTFVLALLLVGCPDDGRKIGDSCINDTECASGFCYGECLEPSLDADGDGLSNSEEKALGTNAADPDSDGDGKPDGEEVGTVANPLNADQDELIDALDSALLDSDEDCYLDEVDARNLDEDPPPSPAEAGCAADETVACQGGSFVCVPPAASPPELCNLVDDDGDGAVDNGALLHAQLPAVADAVLAVDGGTWVSYRAEGEPRVAWYPDPIPPEPAFEFTLPNAVGRITAMATDPTGGFLAVGDDGSGAGFWLRGDVASAGANPTAYETAPAAMRDVVIGPDGFGVTVGEEAGQAWIGTFDAQNNPGWSTTVPTLTAFEAVVRLSDGSVVVFGTSTAQRYEADGTPGSVATNLPVGFRDAVAIDGGQRILASYGAELLTFNAALVVVDQRPGPSVSTSVLAPIASGGWWMAGDGPVATRSDVYWNDDQSAFGLDVGTTVTAASPRPDGGVVLAGESLMVVDPYGNTTCSQASGCGTLGQVCADDGNPCTLTDCNQGVCSPVAVADGGVCGPTTKCSPPTCQAGTCVEPVGGSGIVPFGADLDTPVALEGFGDDSYVVASTQHLAGINPDGSIAWSEALEDGRTVYDLSVVATEPPTVAVLSTTVAETRLELWTNGSPSGNTAVAISGATRVACWGDLCVVAGASGDGAVAQAFDLSSGSPVVLWQDTWPSGTVWEDVELEESAAGERVWLVGYRWRSGGAGEVGVAERLDAQTGVRLSREQLRGSGVTRFRRLGGLFDSAAVAVAHDLALGRTLLRRYDLGGHLWQRELPSFIGTIAQGTERTYLADTANVYAYDALGNVRFTGQLPTDTTVYALAVGGGGRFAAAVRLPSQTQPVVMLFSAWGEPRCASEPCYALDRSACLDGNPCTIDGCEGGTCTHTAVTDGVPCDSGVACEPWGSCNGGSCDAAGTPLLGEVSSLGSALGDLYTNPTVTPAQDGGYSFVSVAPIGDLRVERYDAGHRLVSSPVVSGFMLRAAARGNDGRLWLAGNGLGPLIDSILRAYDEDSQLVATASIGFSAPVDEHVVTSVTALERGGVAIVQNGWTFDAPTEHVNELRIVQADGSTPFGFTSLDQGLTGRTFFDVASRGDIIVAVGGDGRGIATTLDASGRILGERYYGESGFAIHAVVPAQDGGWLFAGPEPNGTRVVHVDAAGTVVTTWFSQGTVIEPVGDVPRRLVSLAQRYDGSVVLATSREDFGADVLVQTDLEGNALHSGAEVNQTATLGGRYADLAVTGTGQLLVASIVDNAGVKQHTLTRRSAWNEGSCAFFASCAAAPLGLCDDGDPCTLDRCETGCSHGLIVPCDNPPSCPLWENAPGPGSVVAAVSRPGGGAVVLYENASAGLSVQTIDEAGNDVGIGASLPSVIPTAMARVDASKVVAVGYEIGTDLPYMRTFSASTGALLETWDPGVIGARLNDVVVGPGGQVVGVGAVGGHLLVWATDGAGPGSFVQESITMVGTQELRATTTAPGGLVHAGGVTNAQGLLVTVDASGTITSDALAPQPIADLHWQNGQLFMLDEAESGIAMLRIYDAPAGAGVDAIVAPGASESVTMFGPTDTLGLVSLPDRMVVAAVHTATLWFHTLTNGTGGVGSFPALPAMVTPRGIAAAPNGILAFGQNGSGDRYTVRGDAFLTFECASSGRCARRAFGDCVSACGGQPQCDPVLGCTTAVGDGTCQPQACGEVAACFAGDNLGCSAAVDTCAP